MHLIIAGYLLCKNDSLAEKQTNGQKHLQYFSALKPGIDQPPFCPTWKFTYIVRA